MSKRKGYLILVVPVLEEGQRADSLWLKVDTKVIDRRNVFSFDWTNDIRHTIYFDTKEEAMRVLLMHIKLLQPHFCEVVEISLDAIKLLEINKGRIPNNPKLQLF